MQCFRDFLNELKEDYTEYIDEIFAHFKNNKLFEIKNILFVAELLI